MKKLLLSSSLCAAFILAACATVSPAAQAGSADAKTEASAINNPAKDVSFFVVGKTELYKQDFDGKLSEPSYYFFAEIFGKSEGQLDSGKLYPAQNGAESEYDFVYSRPNMIKVPRKDFDTLAELNAAFPNGEYTVEGSTPNGSFSGHSVTLEPRADATTVWSDVPRVTLFQNGQSVAQDAIDPDQDLLIKWTPFTKGRPDVNDLVPDPIFAMVLDCRGEWVARSTIPLEDTPTLDYSDTSFRISRERLQPGDTMKLIVEHAELVDTNKINGVVGLATFPVITHVAMKALGQAEKVCPAE